MVSEGMAAVDTLDVDMEDGGGAGEPEVIQENEAFDREYYDDFSWERLQEDDQGRLRPLDTTTEQRKKRQRLLSASQQARIRRGMIRYMELVIDLSMAASATDFRPNRMAVMLDILQSFIREFFDQNPLSHLGIIVIRNGVAELLTELSSSPEAHIKELKAAPSASGPASLQNALEAATEALKPVPSYGSREVLIVFAGLSTCDPGEISDAIAAAKAKKCRVSIVGLSAEVFICREITEQTGGSYGVALSEAHLHELMLQHAPPPPAASRGATARLVRMGFPQRNAEDASGSAFVGLAAELKSGGFTCPKCCSRVDELPCECHVCGLTLVSSPHLARSYHHLFPVKVFEEVAAPQLEHNSVGAGAGGTPGQSPAWGERPGLHCYACLCTLQADGGADASGGVVVRCPNCLHLFCFECDAYIHESLHNCPGCECQPHLAVAAAVGKED